MTFMTLFLLILAGIVGAGLLSGIRIVAQAKVLVIERLGYRGGLVNLPGVGAANEG